jgi:hypothetical protein
MRYLIIKMQKKIILSLAILSVILLSLNFISASGLCRGYDGYYHDCDNSRYFDRYDRGYDDYYSYHGRDYPTRDYYYRDYYRPKRYSRNYYTKIKYDDVEEYKKTINYVYEDRYGTQKYKTTLNQKTEIRLDYDIPYYVIYDNLRYDSQYKDDNYKDDKNHIKQIPWTYSQYKQYH